VIPPNADMSYFTSIFIDPTYLAITQMHIIGVVVVVIFFDSIPASLKLGPSAG
jgi:hypothetical protein